MLGCETVSEICPGTDFHLFNPDISYFNMLGCLCVIQALV